MKNVLTASGLLLAAHLTLAQQPVLPRLQQQLDLYRSQSLQEKLFVHTDRSFYLAGERLWFSLFCVDGTTHQPLDLSRIAYLEVLDRDQKAVAQAKVSLDSSRGNGSLYLPTALASGQYVVRAYTQWMKTTNREFLFEKPITIVNSFRRLGMPTPTDSLTYDAEFFPEGGHLVNGLPARVAFKLTDKKTGRGVDCRGALVGAANDTIARFSSLKFGLGTFTFTPVPAARYRVVLTARNGRSLSRPLPAIDEAGYTMQAISQGDGQLRIMVASNLPNATTVYLIGHTRQQVNVARALPLVSGQAQFSLPVTSLGEGISHLTLFDATGQPVCERLVGRRPQTGLSLQLTPNKASFAPRDQVQVSLTAATLAGAPVASSGSISVYRLDSLQTDEGLTLPDYVWLTSDLRGNVESPSFYLRQTGPQADEALDNLLLTHGWRRFSWNNVIQPKPLSSDQVPEHRGHVILGRVTDSRTGMPAGDIQTYLAIPGKSIQLYNSRSDAKGLVRYELTGVYGPNDIVVQTARNDSLYRVELINPYTETGTMLPFPSVELQPAVSESLQTRSLAMQVQNSYFTAFAATALPPAIDSTTFYENPDERYYLDTYTRFTVLEEVLSEYVPGVHVRRQNGHFELRVTNLPYRLPFEEDPLMLLDGVPIYDTDRLMAFSPLKIKSMDVVTRRYMLGYANFPGIISFKTYKGDLGGFQLDPHAVVLEYDGLQTRREFSAPAYTTPTQLASRLPDFRNLLYWNPAVTTGLQGKTNLTFYTSDQEGRYLLVVHAMTPDGQFATTQQTISVQGALK
ncbi:hypothetical protein [Fibrella arboris]|uniref:hypothetical protein n=1 Tax=Fibrella arboris TaxID=3242486 RepID=UPI003522FA28